MRGNDGNGCNGVSLVSVTGCANLQQTFHENNLVSAFPVACNFRLRGRSFASQKRAPPRAITRYNKYWSISGIHQPRAPRGLRDGRWMSEVWIEKEWTKSEKTKRWRELKVSECRVICIHITARWKGRICKSEFSSANNFGSAPVPRVYESWYLKAHFADL